MEILNSKRLLLRTVQKSDFETLHVRIFSDINVYKYTFGKEGFTFKQTCDFLEKNANFDSKIGLSVLVENENSNIIGLAGIMPYEDDNFEIGFILQKSSWGKGYAQEIGNAQVDFIKNILLKKQAFALVSPENENSINSIKKLGFLHVRTVMKSRGKRYVFVKNLI